MKEWRRRAGLIVHRSSSIRGFPLMVGGLLSVVLGIQTAFAGPTPYGCIDQNNGRLYQYPGQFGYYFAQVATTDSTGGTYLYYTQGLKGNITTEGNPYVYDTSTQNVNEWLMAQENPSHVCGSGCNPNGCLAIGQCTIQVGWQVGYSGGPNLQGCQAISSGETAVVYIEIFDDSSAPCTRASFGAAPSNASYDTRYYATAGNLYDYKIFYEVPSSNNIQVLGYGDYVNQYSAAQAAGEVYVPDSYDPSVPGSRHSTCPILGHTPQGQWNYHGKPASQATFADYMNLYTGSWQQWTDGVAGTHTTTQIQNPYQLQLISNFTEWQSGGPQQ